MAEIRVDPDAAGRTEEAAARPPEPVAAEPSLGELFRQLAQDSSLLIRQEVALAKAEMRENVRSAARSATLLAVGGAIAAVGTLVLSAFLVLLLGELLGNYWLSALIVGVLFLAVGGVMVSSNLKGLRANDLKPEQSLDSLREDGQWIRQEIQEAKRELT